MTKNIALYIRISVKQRDNDTAQTQHDYLRDYVLRHNRNPEEERWSVTKFYKDDGKTGRNLNRPKVRELMTDLEYWATKVKNEEEPPVDIILVKAIDRLTRNTHDGLVLYHDYMQPCNVELISATQYFDTSTSIGRLVFRTLLSMAEFESDIISERVKQGMAMARQKRFI